MSSPTSKGVLTHSSAQCSAKQSRAEQSRLSPQSTLESRRKKNWLAFLTLPRQRSQVCSPREFKFDFFSNPRLAHRKLRTSDNPLSSSTSSSRRRKQSPKKSFRFSIFQNFEYNSQQRFVVTLLISRGLAFGRTFKSALSLHVAQRTPAIVCLSF